VSEQPILMPEHFQLSHFQKCQLKSKINGATRCAAIKNCCVAFSGELHGHAAVQHRVNIGVHNNAVTIDRTLQNMLTGTVYFIKIVLWTTPTLCLNRGGTRLQLDTRLVLERRLLLEVLR